MAQEPTGATWAGAGLADIDPRLSERGPLQGVIIRDYRGAATDISPFENDGSTVKFSPLAADGKLHPNLLGARLVNGVWSVNPNPNLGFIFLGANTEDGGPERNANVENDDLYVLQAHYTYDSAVIRKGKTVAFTLVESLRPAVHALEYECPLNDPDTGELIVGDLGDPNYFVGSQLDPTQVDRQILLFFAKQTDAGPIYRIEPLPRVRLDDQGAKRRTKTDPDAVELTFQLLPDPYFTIPARDGAGVVAGFDGMWVGGSGWEALSAGS